MPSYCGIDIGKKRCDIAIIDGNGKLKQQCRVDSDIYSVLEVVSKYRKTLRSYLNLAAPTAGSLMGWRMPVLQISQWLIR